MLDGDTAVTNRILHCAVEVHRHLGPGLLESVYESALCIEFTLSGVSFKRQVGIPVYYKGELLAEHRPDLIVEDMIVVEVKSVERIAPIHIAQTVNYLRITSLKVGLILNFNSPTIAAGTRRVVRNA